MLLVIKNTVGLQQTILRQLYVHLHRSMLIGEVRMVITVPTPLSWVMSAAVPDNTILILTASAQLPGFLGSYNLFLVPVLP